MLREGRLHQGVGVGPGSGQHSPAPAAGREHEGAGIVLEHPAGEVAAGPRGECSGRGSRRVRRSAPAGCAGAATRTGGRGRGRGSTSVRYRRVTASASSGDAAIARTASAPVSSACAMPSPVIGSTTSAASPTNSARPCVSRAGSYAAGIGQARIGPSGCASRTEGPSHARPIGERRATARRAPCRSAHRRVPSRNTPKPTLARPSPTGNTHAYPGRKSSSNSTHSRRSSTPVKYWRNACHVPRSARSSSAPSQQLAGGGVVAVGRDDPLRPDDGAVGECRVVVACRRRRVR